MSAFIYLSFCKKNVNLDEIKADVLDLALTLNIGIFCDNVSSEYIQADQYIISLADDFRYDNCESLIKPWWYTNTNMSKFITNMNKIKTMVEFFLKRTEKIELWMGTSGDSVDDFDTSDVVINEFIDKIKEKFKEYNRLPAPPSVHFTLLR